MKKIRVTKVHNDIILLSSIALNQLSAGKNEELGYKFRWVIPSMAFSAFRIEALCNLFGGQLDLPKKRYFKKMTYIEKVKHISQFLGWSFNKNEKDKEIWKTIEEMKNFRNILAHTKPQKVVFETEIPKDMPNRGALYFGDHPTIDESVSSRYSVEDAERFINTADYIQGYWSLLCRNRGYDVDEIGLPKYEEII